MALTIPTSRSEIAAFQRERKVAAVKQRALLVKRCDNQTETDDDENSSSERNDAGAGGGHGSTSIGPAEDGQGWFHQHVRAGQQAAIGNNIENGFELALDHLGRKFGGLPVELIYEDDAQKPDVGVQKTQKLIESNRVNFVFIAGYIWSNVRLASLKPLVEPRDHHGYRQCRHVAGLRQTVLALRVFDLVE